jgi:hypothetical protein
VRRISWTKTEKILEGWRKLHNEEFHNLFSWPNIIRIIKPRRIRRPRARDVTHTGRNEQKNLTGKLQEKDTTRNPGTKMGG